MATLPVMPSRVGFSRTVEAISSEVAGMARLGISSEGSKAMDGIEGGEVASCGVCAGVAGVSAVVAFSGMSGNAGGESGAGVGSVPATAVLSLARPG